MLRAVIFPGEKIIAVEVDSIDEDLYNIQEFVDTGETVVLCDNVDTLNELFPDYKITITEMD
jgi:hypothetical protein